VLKHHDMKKDEGVGVKRHVFKSRDKIEVDGQLQAPTDLIIRKEPPVRTE
jgi:hypothetical protein